MINKDDPRLTAYLLGELDESGHDEIQAALADSPELRQHVDGLRETVDAIQSAFGGEVPGGDELTSEQISAVEAAATGKLSDDESLQGQGSGVQVTRPDVFGVSRRTQVRRFAIAAVVLYAVGMTAFAFRGPPLSVALNDAAMQMPVRDQEPRDQEPRDQEPRQQGLGKQEPRELTDRLSAGPIELDETTHLFVDPSTANSQTSMVLPTVPSSRNADSDNVETQALPAIVNQPVMDSPVSRSRMLGRETQELASGGALLNAATATIENEATTKSDDQPIAAGMEMRMSSEDQLGAESSEEEDRGDPVPQSMHHGMQMGGNDALGIPQGDSRSIDGQSIQSQPGSMGMMGGGMGGGGTQRPGGVTQTPPEGTRVPVGRDGLGVSGGAENERLSEFSERQSGAWAAGVDREWLDRLDSPELPGEAAEAEVSAMDRDDQPPAPTSEITTRELEEFGAAGRQSLRLRDETTVEVGGMSRGGEAAPVREDRTNIELSSRLQSGRKLQTVENLNGRRQFSLAQEPVAAPASVAPTSTDSSSVDAVAVDLEEAEASAMRRGGMQKGIADVPVQATNAEAKTWKPASASTNRARLSVGHHDDLLLAARDTYVRIDGFRARVMFDLYYFNDRKRQLEGQFKLRLPDDAALHYFAFGATNLPSPPTVMARRGTGKPGDDVADEPMDPARSAVTMLRKATASTGSDLARRSIDPSYKSESNSTFADVKTAFVAPRQKAALAYEETVRRRVDPALVEWAGPGVFQTKVFPLMPGKLHRIVVGYDVSLEDVDEDRLFQLNLPEGEAGGRVEFDIVAAGGTEAVLDPPTDPFVSGGRAYYRYDSAAPRDYSARIMGTDSIMLTHADSSGELFFATELMADLPREEAIVETRQAILMLDTSWSDRPAAFSRRLKLAEQILTANRDSIDEFAVMIFNVHQQWWQQEFVKNDQANVQEFLAFANQLVLEGATDLHGAIVEARSPAWKPSIKGSAVLPNYFLLSDAVATWGAIDLATIESGLAKTEGTSKGGALFTYKIAGSPSDHVMMQRLADNSGGAVFSLGKHAEYGKVARGHRTRPWQFVSAVAEGAGEVLVDGGATAVYPGQTLLVTGRGEIEGPIELGFRRGSETKSLSIDPRLVIKSPAAARLYGGVAVDALEPLGGETEEIAVAFARYFRVPGRTCSMVMLESEADYKRFGVSVSPEEDHLVVASASVNAMVRSEAELKRSALVDSRSQFLVWTNSLESASLVKVPTALKLAMKGMPKSAFSFTPRRLNCRSFRKADFEEPYLDELNAVKPDFDAVMLESDNTLIAFGADDAIKTASTMVEVRPSDVEVLRSVAYRAIEWKRGDQAAPLVWRITQARPHQPQNLMLLGRSLASGGDLDAAAVCYDLVTAGNWNERWGSAKEIAKLELMSVLQQINPNMSSIGGYARARLRQLQSESKDSDFDVAVLMHWNTDRTDVDLHVTEPSGEVCFYKNRSTKSGGRITDDITEGLGPEMYTLADAPTGAYRIHAKYFRSDANRTKTPTEVLVTLVRDLGRDSIQSQTKRVTLTGQQESESVMQFRWGEQQPSAKSPKRK